MFEAPKPIVWINELINLITIEEKIKVKMKIITKVLTYFIEYSISKGITIAITSDEKNEIKKASIHATILKNSFTKPLKNPKIKEANKIKITKISTYEYDIDLW